MNEEAAKAAQRLLDLRASVKNAEDRQRRINEAREKSIRIKIEVVGRNNHGYEQILFARDVNYPSGNLHMFAAIFLARESDETAAHLKRLRTELAELEARFR